MKVVPRLHIFMTNGLAFGRPASQNNIPSFLAQSGNGGISMTTRREQVFTEVSKFSPKKEEDYERKHNENQAS